MALTPFANAVGPLLIPYPAWLIGSAGANRTMDATGESVTGIGRVYLSSGPGTSKVCSAAGGGSIAMRIGSGTQTFANAGTNWRIGLQDVGAGGIEDGTFDVHADLVGGTDTVTADTVRITPMESGSKTVAFGDRLAISAELTARAGADSVQLRIYTTPDVYLPYVTLDAGAGPVKNPEQPIFTIFFDDGTVGWLGNDSWAIRTETSAAFNTGSTPDEYALLFTLPAPIATTGALVRAIGIASTDDFEVILYGDPLGTPAALITAAVDASEDTAAAGASGWVDVPFTTIQTLAANTPYALALRPTTANNVAFTRMVCESAAQRGPSMLGTNWSQGTRSNQTGAFSSTDTLLPLFGLWMACVDDGAGSGGGGIIARSLIAGDG